MPIEVMENIIGLLPEDSIIIDPFAGSGTTLLAVKNMNLKQKANRKFIGIEIDEDYYNIAINRINGMNVNKQISIFSEWIGKNNN